MSAEFVKAARDEAIQRLMTICPHPTPEERRIYAEWIVDAIVRAAVIDTTRRMIDANNEVSR